MATAALLRPGDVVGGFRVEDVIGIGGMAIVYRAEQVSLGRPVALKVLARKLTNDTVFRERFRREGEHAANLEHPNIVPVYDSGEEDGNLYIAMRLIEGTNLAELIQTRGLTAEQTIGLLRPIASALDTAHAAGLIHRDVKPQNVLISTREHPYLADFGVAKGSNTEGLTATGGFVGSIHYASPEQIKGLTLTPASDVYALTAVLYQCLTGSVPFPRETEAGVMHAHLHDPPPTLPARSGADRDFHTVFARGMAKDPGARYGHAGDLINAAALCVSRLPAQLQKAVPAFPGSPTVLDSPEASPPVAELAVHPTEIVAADELGGLRAAASFTRDDRRRPPAAEPPTARVSAGTKPMRLIVGIAVALIAVAGIVAVVVSGSNGVRASTLRTGNLLLRPRSDWRRDALAVTGLSLTDPIEITAEGVALSAGRLATAARVPASAPATLVAALGAPTQMKLVTLPLGLVKNYLWRDTARGALALTIISTESGEYAIACSTSAADRTNALNAACAAISARASVVGTTVAYPGPDPRVGTALARALALRARALSAVTRLGGHTSLATRSSPLRLLASQDEAAARTLASLSSPMRDAASVSALATQLEREAKLARNAFGAALHNSRKAYERARRALSSKSLRNAVAELVDEGFSGLAATPVELASAPPSPHTARPGAVPDVTVPHEDYVSPPVETPHPKPEKEEEFVTAPQ